MTGVSTLLAPFLTPLLTWLLAGHRVDVDAAGMFLSILWVVVLPIAIGLAVRKFLPTIAKNVTAYLPAMSSLAIVAIVTVVVSHNAAKILSGGLIIVAVVMAHNLCGLALGYLSSSILGMEYKKRVAISVEVGMQNSALASSLAATHFATYPLAAVPGAVFSVWHNISGAVAAKIYGRSAQT